MELQLMVTLATVAVNIIVLIAIKFNDLRHLDMYVKELLADMKTLNTRVDSIGERVAKIEGKLTK